MLFKLLKLPITVYRLSWEHKLWLIPLYLISAPTWVLTLAVPYRRMHRLIGTPYRNTQLVVLANETQQLRAWRLGHLVEALCKYTPWPSKCLVQALLTRFVLCCYGIPHVIYIGICKPPDADQPLASHAWLCVDRWVVSGADGHQAFKVIATYVSSAEVLATATGG